MGKLIGIVLGVVALWLGMQVYTGQAPSLFGGERASAAHSPSTPQRAGAAVEKAHAASEARRDQLMGE